jgi:hypothetical protein
MLGEVDGFVLARRQFATGDQKQNVQQQGLK